ncbi:dynamin family protein [Herbaspirillum sp. NPDC087042]|uniref:dynamin family protein n=1 Tax=Herbaspirillum sp. NPDC087042 TaxID=3364004 RepID=UPI00382F280D
MSSGEHDFIEAVRHPGSDGIDLAPLMTRMREWLASLGQALEAGRIDSAGLRPGSALALRIEAIHRELEEQQRHRQQQWQALAPARALAQHFEGKVMLLVFGKFNAGKSSLCNFLAARFARQGQAVQYFHLEGGQIVASAQVFHEGATETTARLQGVCLGDGLVLLDTPGLHSATDDNAALTQRFLDSADGVLWLTSSTSPGQVQELDELARELRRGKPLLPVVTRSDVIDEDEVDGEIVKLLRNKSDANRADQEADVRTRAADKLRSLGVAQAQLKAPVSVSAHVARTQGEDGPAMAGAGFDRLYAALLALLGPALSYRQRKPGEVLLHHLQEEVLAPMQAHTLPALIALQHAVQTERDSLAARQARIVQLAWREIIPGLPELLEQHAQAGDVQAVCEALVQQLGAAFARHAQAVLEGHALVLPGAIRLEAPAASAYVPASEDMPVSYEKLYADLDKAVLTLLDEQAAALVQHCEERLEALAQAVRRKQDIIHQGQHSLAAIDRDLRGTAQADALAH